MKGLSLLGTWLRLGIENLSAKRSVQSPVLPFYVPLGTPPSSPRGQTFALCQLPSYNHRNITPKLITFNLQLITTIAPALAGAGAYRNKERRLGVQITQKNLHNANFFPLFLKRGDRLRWVFLHYAKHSKTFNFPRRVRVSNPPVCSYFIVCFSGRLQTCPYE